MKVAFYEEDQRDAFLKAIEDRRYEGEEFSMKLEGTSYNYYLGSTRVGYKHVDEEGYYLIDD